MIASAILLPPAKGVAMVMFLFEYVWLHVHGEIPGQGSGPDPFLYRVPPMATYEPFLSHPKEWGLIFTRNKICT